MPEVQLKNKLVTLEDVGEALGSDIIVKGVKGNNENDYRGGDVNLTPANIGAVDKTGDTMTGSLQLLNAQPLIWPIAGGYKWEIYPVTDSGLQFSLLNAGGVVVQTFSITENGALQLQSPLGIPYGGTGATDAAGARENLGAMPAEPPSIELKPSVGSSAGGYIDFHFNGSSADYTTRLIEAASGQLTLLGSLILPSPLGVQYGGTGATGADGARANLHAMRNPDTTSPQYGSGNLNNAPVGFSAWYGPNCVNVPFQAWTSVLTMNFITGYVQQVAFSWLGNQIAYRVCDNGAWYAWKYITLS